ncbi:AP endonuclease family 1 domain protein [Candidatus Rhodobacter oscarellae]|uniref:AP endonuclease family 1 domain protein n=1 Tax=Candidatus Rhodobacter oscarellae TaxID=1675527 RepID=A0A0J9H1Y0_9RHOB|nr:AP endonuclease family 1 domain protein [Candidatus Rhodobacter lobularis]
MVTFQELSDRNKAILELLAKTYPHVHICDFSRWSDLAVLSRHPMRTGSQQCSPRRGLAAAQVETDGGPIWVASIHLPWPYPYDQAARLRLIEPMLAKMDGPVVIGADLNMFPVTRPSRRIAQVSGTRELRPLRPTLFMRGRLPMFIDHVYAASGRVERRPLLGSDHYGLVGHVQPN